MKPYSSDSPESIVSAVEKGDSSVFKNWALTTLLKIYLITKTKFFSNSTSLPKPFYSSTNTPPSFHYSYLSFKS